MEKEFKLDKKDFMLLYEMDYNSRIPLSKLARKIGLSVQSTKYRLDNLFRRKVILGTMAVVDIHHLGFFTYRIYLRLQKTSEAEEKSIIDYLIKHQRTIWVVSTSGRWDIEVLFAARNPVQANNFLREVRDNAGQHIRNYTISSSTVNYHFERTYLIEGMRRKERNPLYGFEPPKEELDGLDVRILKFLSLNARISNQEIAQTLGVSFNTIKQRVAKLEKKGIIQSYRIFINLGKINRTFYKSLITTEGFSDNDEKKMLSFCRLEPAVAYLVECFGEWDLELEAEVRDEAEFRDIAKRFRNTFSGILQNYEILHVYKEHKMNYFPMADELLPKTA